MDDLDRPHVPVFGYSWVPGRRFAYLAEQRLIALAGGNAAVLVPDDGPLLLVLDLGKFLFR